MASGKAHQATGFAAGIIAAAMASAAGGSTATCSLAIIAAVSGATAPDWLEVAWWSRPRRLWIKHRTITHWGVAWVLLLLWSYQQLGKNPGYAIAFGFACGGLMHLIADWPNPRGVPWILPRHSLNLWTSGHCDLIVVGVSWVAALIIADSIWFHHEYGRMLLDALQALRANIARRFA